MDSSGEQAGHPFHVEAYPRLDLRIARKQVLAGRDMVIWYDQNWSLVGMATLTFGSGEQLTIAARLRSIPYIDGGTCHDDLSCTVISRAGNEDDVLTSCRSCGTERRVVVLVANTWLCRDCQRLGYRSTITGTRVRDTERLEELQRQTGNGRPKYMRHHAYQELRREEALLRHMLDGDLAVPPAHQQYVLRPHWMPAPPELLHCAAISCENAAQCDTLELLGSVLFDGPSLEQRAEKMIRSGVAPAYRELRALTPKVSALQVRRQFTADTVGEVPVLGSAGDIVITGQARTGELKARPAVPFTGNPDLFKARPPAASAAFPMGSVANGKLVLAARFSPGNAAFVPALLHAELDLVRDRLARQEQASRELRKTFPQLLKRLVVEELPRVKPSRRTR